MGYWRDLLQEASQVMERKKAQVEKATVEVNQGAGMIGGAAMGGVAGAYFGHTAANFAGGPKAGLVGAVVGGGLGIYGGGKIGSSIGKAVGEHEAIGAGLKVAKTHQTLKRNLGREPKEHELDYAWSEREAKERRRREKEREERMIRAHQLSKMRKEESTPVQDYMSQRTFAESIQEQPEFRSGQLRGWWESPPQPAQAEESNLRESGGARPYTQSAPSANRSVISPSNMEGRRRSAETGPWGRSKSFAEHVAEDFQQQPDRRGMVFGQALQPSMREGYKTIADASDKISSGRKGPAVMGSAASGALMGGMFGGIRGMVVTGTLAAALKYLGGAGNLTSSEMKRLNKLYEKIKAETGQEPDVDELVAAFRVGA